MIAAAPGAMCVRFARATATAQFLVLAWTGFADAAHAAPADSTPTLRLRIPSLGAEPVIGRLHSRTADTVFLVPGLGQRPIAIPVTAIATVERAAGTRSRSAEYLRVGAVLGLVGGALATADRDRGRAEVTLAGSAVGAVLGAGYGATRSQPIWAPIPVLEWHPGAIAADRWPLPRAGTRVRVLAAGDRVAEPGAVIESRADTLWFKPDWQRDPRLITREEVDRLELSVARGNYALGGMLAGAAGGTGVGLFLSGLDGDDDPGRTLSYVAAFAVPSALLGALAGGFLSYEQWQVLYDARSALGTASGSPALVAGITLVPLRGGAGFALTVRR